MYRKNPAGTETGPIIGNRVIRQKPYLKICIFGKNVKVNNNLPTIQANQQAIHRSPRHLNYLQFKI